MNNFNRDKTRDFKRRDSFKNSRPQMHETICSDCGKKCEVPFKPTNQKPVYCRDCFGARGGNKGKDGFQDRRENRVDILKKDNQYKEQLDQLISKLDIIINILNVKEQDKKPKKILKKKTISKKK